MDFNLDGIKKTPAGKLPPIITIYGTDGVGKTGFALKAPNPIYLPTEPRFSHYETLNIFQTEDNPNEICKSFGQMCAALNALIENKHDYKTVVIDTLDHLEPIVWDAVIKKYPTTEKGREVNSIGDYGYGQGYLYADEAWQYLFKLLYRLREEKKMMIILLSHYHLKNIKSAESEDYGQFKIKLQDRAADYVREVCDAVLFAKFKTYISKVGDGLSERNVGKGTGERVLVCQPRPSCVVKNSFKTLPDEIPLDWDKLAEHIPFLTQQTQQEIN